MDVIACVYRARNAATVARLAGQARAAGARVRLWALDAPVDALAEWTAGTGPGTKFELVNRLLATTPVPDDAYVVVADDDVRMSSLAAFLRVVKEARLDLAQPAHGRRSSSTHPVTRLVPGAVARLTRFVEIGPVFAVSPAWRDEVLPFPDDVGMGWGLEADWYGLHRRGARLGVVDAAPMRHLGPIATAYDQSGERARLAERLAAQGLSGLDAIQDTLGVWLGPDPVALTINYNTPALLSRLLRSLRAHAAVPVLVVDGSDRATWRLAARFTARRYGAAIHQPGYNIHHGPGMDFGIRYLAADWVLVVDSDVELVRDGVVPLLTTHAAADVYAVGTVQPVDDGGIDDPDGPIAYLHPRLMLLNRAAYLANPPATRHGAPMIEPMRRLAETGEWRVVDVPGLDAYYLHEVQGTVMRTGGFHLGHHDSIRTRIRRRIRAVRRIARRSQR